MKYNSRGKMWAVGFVVLLFGAGFFVSRNQAEAFSIRAGFRNDTGFFSVLFDGTVASSSATSSLVSLNAGTPTVTSVFTDMGNSAQLFGMASDTLNIGDTVTVSSSIKDPTNATNTSITAQTLIAPIKIAEVRTGSGSNNLDEYVMLYNQMGASFNASGTLFLHKVRGTSDISLPLSFATTSIPGNGFFLIASASGYSGSLSPDAIYSTSTDAFPATSTAVYINTTSTANVNILDKVEWGASAQVTTSTNATTTFASTVAIASLSNDNVLMRKASSGSTSSTVATGGSENNKGASYDTRNNSTDFVVVSSTRATIKNSSSPVEFPFGGGKTDTTVPTVMGSFPGGMGGEMVPTDLTMIGFNFTKPVDPSTVTSSTVSLVVQGQSTNLCSTVTYSNSTMGAPGNCTLTAGTLVAGTTYAFTIKGSSSTPNVADFAGNKLNQSSGQHGTATHDYQITFSPASGFTRTPTVPPSAIGTSPSAGSANITTNISKVSISFSQAMDSTTFGSVTLAATSGGSNLLTNASVQLSGDGKSATIPVASSLSIGTSYTLTVPTSVKNSNGVPLTATYVSRFSTGSSADTTGPEVLGKLPNIATGVPVNATDIHATTDDSLDPSTITSSTVKVADAAGNVLPGSVSYNPLAKEILWNGGNVFQPSTTYTVTLNASGTTPSINNVAGLALQDTDGSSNSLYQFSFTTGSADATGPGILFANANGFSLAVTFNEAVKSTEAGTLANYTVTSNATSVSLSTLNGHTVTYDSQTRTALLNNLALTAGNSFSVAVQNIHDLSNNLIDPAKSSFGGTVQASSQNGGSVGVGGSYIAPTGFTPTGFSTSTFGFVPQAEVRPYNSLAGFKSNYSVNIPLSKQIAATTGQIVLSFDSSFTLANATTDSFSPANSDINGPGTGTVTIGSVAGDDSSHTITVTMGATATRGGLDTHDFLHFDLANIQNSSVPKTSDGYKVDIRTVNGTTTLESITAKPFFITGGGSSVGNLTISLAASGATNGTTTVYLFSPQTGSFSSSTTAFSSGNATTTFASLPNGSYNVMTDPIITLTGGVFLGQATPTPVTVSGATSKSLTLNAVGSLASSTVNINASSAGKKISVFAGGPLGYVDVATSTINGTTSVVIYYPASGDYNVGVGPQMNKTFNGPPPSPDYILPQPIKVSVASGLASRTTINFSLTSAGLTIPGTVKDDSNKLIANANVFAYSPQGGFGTFGQSGSDGVFSLKISAGNYKVGASSPGFPSSQDISVVVNSAGELFVNGASASSTSITLKLSKPSTSIGGTISDASSTPVQGAQVWAFCDNSIQSNSCFGPSGHAEAQTGSDGTYTLYVGSGTWKVGAFIPGFGQQPLTTVTISGSSNSTTNFQPSSSVTFKTVSGTVCTNTASDCTAGTPVAVSGANVRIEGKDASGNFLSNSTISGSDGAYSFTVPSGSGSSYKIRGVAPSLGELPATAAFTVTANVTAKDLVVGAGRSVSVNLSNNPSAFDVFMRFANTTTGISNYISFHNNSSGTIQLPNGVIYSLDMRSPGFSLSGNSVSKTSGTATYTSSTQRLDLSSGSDAVVLTLTFASSTVISGSTKDASSNSVANAWVDVSNTSGSHFGTQSNASGTYSVAIQDGSYTITAYSPGYLPNSKSLSLSNGTTTLGTTVVTSSTVNLTLTKSSLSISGTVTASGNPASGALIKGTLLGGGTAVTIASTDGTYSLPVSAGTWSVSAVVDGYNSGNYASNPVVVSASSVTSVDITLTSPATLADPIAQTITPSQGGTLRNSSGTLQVSIPANALGSSANSGQVKATEAAVVGTASARPVGKGQDIKAYDSSNNSVTTLNDNVTISLDVASSSFSANSISSTSTATKLKLGYFDTSLSDWVPLTTTISYQNGSGVEVTPNSTLSNVDHITLSAPSNHFTVFGSIITSENLSPNPPTGVSATVTSREIGVSWTAPTTNTDGSTISDLMEYEIYRDTSATGNFTTQVNSSQVASGTLSFTDASANTGTDYYYKVTATDTSGNESSKSSSTTNAVNIPAQTAGVGAGASPGGGGGGSYTPPTTPTTPTTPNPTTPAAPRTSALPTAVSRTPAPLRAAPIAISIQANLKPGMVSKEVRALQELLAQDKSIYPEGVVNGSFGPATQKAVERFQKKYGVVTSGAPTTTGFGAVGPKTRAKIQEIFNTPASAISAPASAAATAPISAASPAPLTRTLSPGNRSNEVSSLQEMLSRDSTIYPEGNVSGYFGALTRKAVERFQEKYGIAGKGDTGYGTVGPKTRARLNDLFGNTPATPATPATPTVSPAIPATPAANTALKLQELQKQLEELLKKAKPSQ